MFAKRIGIGCITILALILVLAALLPQDDSPSTERRIVNEKAADAQIEYEIVDEKIYDAPIKTQKEQHVLVSGNITEETAETLLRQLYSKAMATRGYKYHDKLTNVYIYLYDSAEKATSGQGLWLAMLMQSPVDSQPRILVNKDRIANVGQPKEEKFGLSEEKRRQIFEEMVRAQHRATAEAETMYPLPDPLRSDYSQAAASSQIQKQCDLESKLREQYTNEVMQRYGVTDEQIGQISTEALQLGWPLPKD